jgi:pimeloyl-ACP methyl ester carboxylesterase
MPLYPIGNSQIEVDLIDIKSSLAPIVFLHEGLGSVAMWRSRGVYWPELVCQSTGRNGVVYSRRGYGQSSPIADVRGANRLMPDYMHDEAWKVLPELLSALQIEHPVLLGHSDGATIALLFASCFSATACIAMAPHVMVEDISIRSIEAAKLAFETGELKARLSKYHQDVECAFWQWNDVWLSPAFRSFDIRQNCRQITNPVLALQGKQDAYGTLQQIEDIQPSGPIERQVINNCGHSPHRDQPEETLAYVTAFLADKA